MRPYVGTCCARPTLTQEVSCCNPTTTVRLSQLYLMFFLLPTDVDRKQIRLNRRFQRALDRGHPPCPDGVTGRRGIRQPCSLTPSIAMSHLCHQIHSSLRQPDADDRAAIERQIVLLDPVAEDHPVLRHL